jgi:uncharacterized protein with PIN domain
MGKQVYQVLFVADQTVGKLCKWLRLLGFDVKYAPDLPRRPGLIASSQSRIILTRSRYHYKSSDNIKVLRLVSDNALEQLGEVITALDLKPTTLAPCSRCSRCNLPTTSVDKHSVFGKVPDYIWETQAVFHQCGQCLRIYWPGSHCQRIKKIIAQVMPGQKASDAIES